MTDCSRVLLVDDDEAIRDVLSEALLDEGYQVLTAANGQEALALLRDGNRPCLILLDLMMPIMDGRQFRSHQVSDPGLAGIPVVVITADASATRKAAELNAAAGLSKPIRLDRLLTELERHCRNVS